MIRWRNTGMVMLVTGLIAFASVGGGFHWFMSFAISAD